MLKILKTNMSNNSYCEFIDDYRAFNTLKNTQKWRNAMSFKDDKIYCKDYFNKLSDKYNYIEYYNTVLDNNTSIHRKINTALKEKGIDYGYCLKCHYVTEIYISFIIEYIIKQEIESRKNIKVISNKYLDNVLKADLYIKDKYIQIKSVSFLDIICFESALKPYLLANPDLKFIFYIIKPDNIYFASTNDNLLHDINYLNDLKGFANCYIDDYKSLNDLILAVSAAI